MSKSEQLQIIANRFFKAHGGSSSAKQMAAWAIEKEYWKPERSSMIKQCAHELAAAMGDEYFTDAQGRRVRAKHAARIMKEGVQQTLWDDIRTAPRDYMEISVKQRRQQIVGECFQIKVDVDSYNENRCPEDPIQFVLSFVSDVAELEALKKHEASLGVVSSSPSGLTTPARRSRTGAPVTV